MASDRVLKLFVVATVLAAAWYAGSQTGPGMAIPVAIVGLAAAYWRAVLGIPVAIAMAAVAVYVPGVAIGATVVVAFLAIVAAYVNAALSHGPIRSSSATPGDGNLYFGSSIGDFDGGGCDGGF
jgi:hypothetical protein